MATSVEVSPRDRPHRTHMVMRATMSSGRIPPQQILIRNISASGIGARTRTTPPHVGERVIIAFEAIGSFQATIRWVIGNRFGMMFSHEIDPHVFHFSSNWQHAPLPKPEEYFVADRFKPETRAWRPGVKTPSNPKP